MVSYPNFVRGPLLDDMPENHKNIDAQSVSFRDTPEIKWKHRCLIK